MSATHSLRPGTSIADPFNPSHVLKPNADGSLNIVSDADGAASPISFLVPNSADPITIKADPGTLFGVTVFNNSNVIAYLKIFDDASPDVGVTIPKQRILIPANSNGAGAVLPFPVGVEYNDAITAVVVTGYDDDDSTAPEGGAYIFEAYYR